MKGNRRARTRDGGVYYFVSPLVSCALVWCVQSPCPAESLVLFGVNLPLSGKYYLDNAGRKEKVKVKMVDNEVTTDVIVEDDAEEIRRFRRDLNLC